MLSLIVWTLIITTSIKYVAVIMRADNDGEGGILALMSLLGIKHGERVGIISIGILGAALLYGDGAITPAISVLSALEGIKAPVPQFAPYVLPLSVLVLIGVFALQPQGSGRIGRLFGPIMTVWFLTIGVLGIHGILRHPGVLAAIDPRYGLGYLFTHGMTGFLVLGGVFLCATGAEALYADMGHFGPFPIRVAWYGLVLPTLLLNYAGQAAIVVDGTAAADANPFFALCPAPLQVPLVALATVATIIASQAIISGTFSMTRQAIQLGLCPRLHITQTSSEGYGQIYVGFVNWVLMALTLGLTLAFRSSDNLAAAFGIAVSLTMFLTTILIFLTMREVWGWSLWLAVAVAGLFAIVDLSFVAANLMKVFEGGWVPLVVAGLLVLRHVDLAAGPRASGAQARARHAAARWFHQKHARQDARRRHGGLLDEPHRRRAGAAAPQFQAQQGAASAHRAAPCGDAEHPARSCGETRRGHPSRRRFPCGRRLLRLHAEPQRAARASALCAGRARVRDDGDLVLRRAGHHRRRAGLALRPHPAGGVRRDASQRAVRDGVLPHPAQPGHRARRPGGNLDDIPISHRRHRRA